MGSLSYVTFKSTRKLELRLENATWVLYTLDCKLTSEINVYWHLENGPEWWSARLTSRLPVICSQFSVCFCCCFFLVSFSPPLVFIASTYYPSPQCMYFQFMCLVLVLFCFLVHIFYFILFTNLVASIRIFIFVSLILPFCIFFPCTFLFQPQTPQIE